MVDSFHIIELNFVPVVEQVSFLLFLLSQCRSKGQIHCICINRCRDWSSWDWTKAWNRSFRSSGWNILWHLWQIWTCQWTVFGQLLYLNGEYISRVSYKCFQWPYLPCFYLYIKYGCLWPEKSIETFQSYDATTHFETTVMDVLNMYTMITGKVRYLHFVAKHLLCLFKWPLFGPFHDLKLNGGSLVCLWAGSWPQCGFKCCQCCRRMRIPTGLHRRWCLLVRYSMCLRMNVNVAGGICMAKNGVGSDLWWWSYVFIVGYIIFLCNKICCFKCWWWELICRFQASPDFV